jgi:thiamine pyrophosphate-dependent acetolactate synthase large subunit-like protein
VSTPVTKPGPQTGAGLLVQSLEAQGVEYVFGIPGAKIDKVFDTLLDSTIKTVVCRHEQNAAFIAGGIGRMTGKAGVALVTSGPGCSNLVTGLATANSEGDPVVAIGGAVPMANRLKQIHQSMDTVSLFRPITKFSAEIDAPEAVSEIVANAFRAAESGRPGAAFISAPQDIMTGEVGGDVLTRLDEHLTQFEANATKRGAQVHWACDAAEHNEIVYGILHEHGVTELIKSKSMLQEECVMTPFLAQRGITVIESDLGERIQQLDG